MNIKKIIGVIIIGVIIIAVAYLILNKKTTPVVSGKEIVYLTEDKAKEKAKQILANMGYELDEIKSIELKSLPYKDEKTWELHTENYNITLDGVTGNLEQFSDNSFDDTKIKPTANKREAEKVGKEIYTKLGYTEGEYGVSNFERDQTTENSDLWKITYSKKYDDIYNFYESVKILFSPEAKRIKILTISENPTENNPVKISKEKAIQIATDKFNKLRNNKTINTIETELTFTKGNGYIAIKEGKTTFEEAEKANNKVRKAWTVVIDYTNKNTDIVFVQKDMFYVDCTTGEIIGGDSIL